eukprot:CAMPEP_0202690408 /NCGR_PEP_ID=MMETSP1385-20130828/5400_1 /ASSEMBLY_ACC=CAM_ASM_000861 /TAXON_ID=933848 /ORGANISM="Elphidium margaritaceum" /LENGTH=72 /DNA_ID=CAMNT_0049345669 /DNA_START=21 /DNA_END=236 /DNA_ORIENTATION=+
MSFNFLTVCSRGSDDNVKNRRHSNSPYTKFENETIQEREEEIERLKANLKEEQKHSEELEEVNETLQRQIAA